jgi:hypothetical protein
MFSDFQPEFNFKFIKFLISIPAIALMAMKEKLLSIFLNLNFPEEWYHETVSDLKVNIHRSLKISQIFFETVFILIFCVNIVEFLIFGNKKTSTESSKSLVYFS